MFLLSMGDSARNKHLCYYIVYYMAFMHCIKMIIKLTDKQNYLKDID